MHLNLLKNECAAPACKWREICKYQLIRNWTLELVRVSVPNKSQSETGGSPVSQYLLHQELPWCTRRDTARFLLQQEFSTSIEVSPHILPVIGCRQSRGRRLTHLDVRSRQLRSFESKWWMPCPELEKQPREKRHKPPANWRAKGENASVSDLIRCVISVSISVNSCSLLLYSPDNSSTPDCCTLQRGVHRTRDRGRAQFKVWTSEASVNHCCLP